MSKREQVRVELFDYSYGDEKMPLVDFLKVVSDALASVPEEYRASATFEAEYDWGDTPSKFKAYYDRPQTDEEVATDAQQAAEREAAQVEYNRAQYRRLKAMFEDVYMLPLKPNS